MITLTKTLFEDMSQYGYVQAANGAWYPPEYLQKYATANIPMQGAAPVAAAPAPVVAAPPPVVAAPPPAPYVAPVQPNIARGVRVARQMTPTYKENLRQTFNTLPGKGKNLHIAGTGQTGPVNPTDQKTFDAKFSQVAAKNTAGIPAAPPAVAPPPVVAPPLTAPAPTVMPPNVNAIAPNIPNQVGATQPGDLAQAGQHFAKAAEHGLSATGEAIKSGAKKAAQLAAEHPGMAGVAAGAVGALGLRKLLTRNSQPQY